MKAIDLATVREPLDQEDADVLAMFHGRNLLNECLLVEEPEMFIVTKAEVAEVKRKQEIVIGTIAAVTAAVVMMLMIVSIGLNLNLVSLCMSCLAGLIVGDLIMNRK